MIAAVKNYLKGVLTPPVPVKGAAEAYDIWSENYDAQPGNLMLDLDERVFGDLLKGLDLKRRRVADIGCGTGRHWDKLTTCNPATITGFDVSQGMLSQLQAKFPDANTRVINEDTFSALPSAIFDVIISTLTVAHIEDIESALTAWGRILKNQGDVIITDFHPHILARGGQRTFRHQQQTIAVQNFVHPVAEIKRIMGSLGFAVEAEKQLHIDESVRHYYTSKGASSVYDKYKGDPVIYGIHFKRPQ